MVSFILPGNSATGGYEVANSLRFNDDDSACLNRSNGSSPSSQRIFTFSAWVKRGTITGNNQSLMTIQDTGDGDPRVRCAFRDDDKLFFDVSASNGSGAFDVRTTAVFRDVNAWYHFVFRIDTTQSTAADRVKMYVNGTQITSFSSTTYGSQNYDLPTNLNEINIGTVDNNSRTNFFDGYLAEVVYCDGQSLDPTSFGEFDEDSPTIWRPIDVSGLTFGTNGFYLDFEDSSNLGNDANGGTDFTANNLAATDQSTDTCTNNYATLNPLHFNATIPSANTLSEGNLVFTSSQGSSAYPGFYSTIAVSQGKWYAEFKATTADGSTLGIGEGIPSGGFLGGSTNDGVIFHNGNFYTNGSGASTGYDAWSDDDILGVALDLDNNKVYFHKNNTYMASGNPAGNSGGEAITAAASTNSGVYHFCAGDASSGTPAIQCNFGSPPFAISSGNSDANGYGNFEYSVPSGYYALNSKNLAEFG